MYQVTYSLKNSDVNLHRRLRTSRLMEMLQEACIAHTEELGAGREKTLDKGILWVVIQQHLTIMHMPEYDDEIIIQTWPGETMHVLFPRYFRIINAKDQKTLLNGSSLWTLVDQKTRKMVFADKYGIDIKGESSIYQLDLPKTIAQKETDHSSLFTVPFSYCDLNGHMNNTRYFELAEDTLDFAKKGKKLTAVTTEYVSEARFNKNLTLHWKEEENKAYITGEAEKLCFRMLFQYTD